LEVALQWEVAIRSGSGMVEQCKGGWTLALGAALCEGENGFVFV
jgi:hypothetical protein